MNSTVIPGVRYKDCLAAIEWLCNTLGFEKHAVYMGKGDIVEHAQLTRDGGMLMLGSIGRESWYTAYTTTPAETGGRETHSVSLYAADCDAAYAQAKAAGAEFLKDLEEQGYGGKAFTVRDLEGYLWHIGSYDPWAKQ